MKTQENTRADTLIITALEDQKESNQFIESNQNILSQDNVNHCQNPVNENDIFNCAAGFKGRTLISLSHGTNYKSSIIPGYNYPVLVLKFKSEIKIPKFLQLVNQASSGSIHQFHLSACFIATGFNQLNEQDTSNLLYRELLGALRNNQALFLHGSDNTGDRKASYLYR